MLAIIKQFVRRMLMGKGKGILQIPPQKAVDDFSNDLFKKFKQNGVSDEAVNNTNDVKAIWNQITNREAQILSNNLRDTFSKLDAPLTSKKAGEVLDLTGKKIDTSKPILGGKNVPEDVVTETITLIKSKKPIDAMKEANLVIGRKGKYKNLTIDESQDILKKTNDHIFERDIKYDEFGEIIKPDPEDFAHGGRSGTGLNYLLGEDDQNSRVPYAAGSSQGDFNQFLKDREQRDKEEQKRKFKKDFEDWKKWQDTEGGTIDWAAEGGRIGLGLGGISKARRAFLKLMGGAAATGAAAKTGLFGLIKAGKPTAGVLTSVPIKAGVDGMPVWFKPLVNKVIKEGTDVTKELGTIERQLVHKTKLPNSKTDVYVTQDLNTGDVLVDIGSGKHGFSAGHHGQPVRLEYRAGEDIMTGPDADDLWKIGEREPHVKTKTRKEFTTTEPKKITKTKEEFWVEEAEFSGGHPENIKFEESTFEKFGQHGSDFSEVEMFATGKVKKAKPLKKREDLEWAEGRAEAEAQAIDDADDVFSSGGRVPLGAGGDPGTSSAEEVREAWKDYLKEKEKGTFKGSWEEWQPIWIRANLAQGGRVPLVKGKIVKGIMSLGKKPKSDYKVGLDKLSKQELREYKNDFNKEILNMSPEDQLRDEFPGISDKLIRQILTDKNPQRIAEVKQTMREALEMQEKGMGHEEIINIFEKMKGRKPNATGGRASLSNGGLAGMLGE